MSRLCLENVKRKIALNKLVGVFFLLFFQLSAVELLQNGISATIGRKSDARISFHLEFTFQMYYLFAVKTLNFVDKVDVKKKKTFHYSVAQIGNIGEYTRWMMDY